MAHRMVFLASILALHLCPEQAGAQVLALEDLESAAIESSGIANVIPALGLFGVSPGFRSARLSIDAAALGTIDVDLLAFPLAHEFEPIWRGVRPYTQFTVGRFDLDKTVGVAVIPASPTGLAVSMSGETFIAGLGATIPLSGSTTVRPMLLGGYARVRSSAATSGPFSGLLLSVVDGVLADARLESPVVGASLELHEAIGLDGGIAIDGSLGIGALYAPVTRATDRAIDQPIPFPSVSARFEADGPIRRAKGGRAFRWFGFGGMNYVPALPDEVAGVPVAAELGIGLTLRDLGSPDGMTVRATAMIGDHATGWSLVASVRF